MVGLTGIVGILMAIMRNMDLVHLFMMAIIGLFIENATGGAQPVMVRATPNIIVNPAEMGIGFGKDMTDAIIFALMKLIMMIGMGIIVLGNINQVITSAHCVIPAAHGVMGAEEATAMLVGLVAQILGISLMTTGNAIIVSKMTLRPQSIPCAPNGNAIPQPMHAHQNTIIKYPKAQWESTLTILGGTQPQHLICIALQVL